MSRPSLAALNDRFRQTMRGGRIFLTDGITALSAAAQAEIVDRVRQFNVFTEDNDPYGEHDFGAFDHPEAGKVFWKIDYYDPEMQSGSNDPSDPAQTCRVLTILLAEEW